MPRWTLELSITHNMSSAINWYSLLGARIVSAKEHESQSHMPVLQTLLSTRGTDPTSRVYLMTFERYSRQKYVQRSYQVSWKSDSTVEIGGGVGAQTTWWYITTSFLLGRGIGKIYEQCKSDHNHNFTSQCLHMENNPNFYMNLYKWKPYAHVHRPCLLNKKKGENKKENCVVYVRMGLDFHQLSSRHTLWEKGCIAFFWVVFSCHQSDY